MQLDKVLYNEINDYCKLNNLKTRDFIHKLLKESFLKEKYGTQPFFMKFNHNDSNESLNVDTVNNIIQEQIEKNNIIPVDIANKHEIIDTDNSQTINTEITTLKKKKRKLK